MAADPRIHELMDHVDRMIELLTSIQEDMKAKEIAESKRSHPDRSKISFFASQFNRAEKAIDLLDEEMISILIGLNNLSGPILYMEDEE